MHSTWLIIFPKHYYLQLQSFPWLCSNLEHTLGTISFVAPSCSWLWMVPFSHYRQLILSLTFQETHSGILSEIQIRKLYCFLVTLFSQIWKEITIKLLVKFIFLKLPQLLSLFHQTFYFSPLRQKLCPFGARMGKKLKPDTLRRKIVLWGTNTWHILLLCCLLQLWMCEFMLHWHNFWIIIINQFKMVSQLVDEDSLHLTDIIDEEYSLRFKS